MEYRSQLPAGPFGTIYADPPWSLSTKGVRRRLHYDRMTIDEIKAIDPASVCIPDAHLWLWTTNPHLPEALEVVRAWGFEYRSLLTWDKELMGTGWWLRSQTEHVVFASRTKKLRRNPGSIRTLLRERRGSHSKKPDALRDIIESLSPGPYLEMFARSPLHRDEWVSLVSDSAPRDQFDD